VAEQPAAAARGVRHLRHEGGDERHPVDEGFNGRNGWAIGGRETVDDEEAQDVADANELYRLLEEEVAPRFYARDGNGVPGDWIATMRAAIEAAIWQFSTARMLGEYVDRLYRPAAAPIGEPARASV
jgi:glucan phosphorylase